MPGQLCEVLVELARPVHLQCLGRGAVQPDGHPRRDTGPDGVAGQRVGEAQLTGAHLRKQARSDCLVGGAEAVLHVGSQHPRRNRQWEPAPDHGAGLDQPARVRSEPLNPGGDGVAHRARRPPRFPRPVDDSAGDLPDEERVAAGGVVHLGDGGTGRAEGVELSADVRRAEPAQVQPLTRRGPLQAGQRPGRGCARLGLPQRGDEQQRRARGPVGEVAQHEQRRLVCPVDVVEHNDQRRLVPPRSGPSPRRRRPPESGPAATRRHPQLARLPPALRNTSRHGQNAGAPSVSAHRPHTTRSPAASPASSWQRRVLPIPASPMQSTSRPRPPRASSSQPRSAPSSRARPSRGGVIMAHSMTQASATAPPATVHVGEPRGTAPGRILDASRRWSLACWIGSGRGQRGRDSRRSVATPGNGDRGRAGAARSRCPAR